jgi:hypothetical protein
MVIRVNLHTGQPVYADSTAGGVTPYLDNIAVPALETMDGRSLLPINLSITPAVIYKKFK